MSKHNAKEKRKIVPVCLLMVLALAAAGIAGYALWQGNMEYTAGDDVYDEVSRKIHSTAAADASVQRVLPQEMPREAVSSTGTMTPPGVAPLSGDTVPQVEIPALSIDWEELESINEDAAAWLYCPDTVIDYPVVAAKDYDYYLTHLIDGTRNKNGTLFLDYNCAQDFSDRLSIIYGHHMKSGKMFGTIVKYKEQEYYEQHPYMYLYTREGNYRIDLIYGCVIGAQEWSDKSYMYQENADSLLEYAKKNTTFESGLVNTDNDRIIALSTCSYEFDEARYIVLGIMIPEYEARSEVD